MRQALNLIVIP